MSKWDNIRADFKFLDDETHEEKPTKGRYKILIADDDEEVHKVTTLVLGGFSFDDRGIEILHAYSGEETRKIMNRYDDIAVLFLDVVMESKHSGLDAVKYIREELGNEEVRIILRTGQPGEAPENEIIRDYDINDYRVKTEFTNKRLFTSLYSAIRSYRDIQKIKEHKKGLEKIISASAALFEKNTLDAFLVSILEQLSTFKTEESDILYVQKPHGYTKPTGFISLSGEEKARIIAATGRFSLYIGKELEDIAELREITENLNKPEWNGENRIIQQDKGFLIFTPGQNSLKSWVYLEGKKEQFDFDLINLFMSNFAIALDNYMMTSYINEAQKDIVYTLANAVESHFTDTGFHVKRISEMMYNFSLVLGSDHEEAETLKFASTMHDLGKIVIPDRILKKPGKLTEEEFEEMKTHTTHGYLILKHSNLPILKISSEISLRHHERYDGTGYPDGMAGEAIPRYARMMTLVDVFDAMSHKRIYKEPIPREKCLKWIEENKGKQFDPELADIFIENIDKITRFSESELNY
ncbi:MAG: DUF3369 domain-containing protein [Spirochaetales bacterium]|nr:DUF3369 domain-containing protein [Spirochaetales bacterium]